ncbi:MAG: hypothetical protein J7K47_06775 [Thermoplasmata archaeon]|nr:hypothetical protein [Thermoplasmata archaeon]
MFEVSKLENVSFDGLRVKERILLNLFLYGGWDTPLTIMEIRTLLYGFLPTQKERDSKYGSLYKELEELRIRSYVERFNNPVRYKCKYSPRTAGYLAYISRKLGFKEATPEDFLHS